ncbi:uncharacterized protein LOC122034150 [Zingiber officinale]|uniref:SAM domain-containing protein n=1 Tax=Zingiber officinale TaxID=94328 RepID=A0A8J5ET24_ZINOF|nr:uncharacterized protein LOC122034150 [Zingiber officinale]KAG6469394.1 hypothetical protein ZIOFF_074109 [Zingiber officinale]
MDWYWWLSKSTLDPLLVYDYSLLFTANELEEDDIKHFNHEFLQSMGVSIAKHRLEILKVANKSDSKTKYSLFAAITRTKIYITEHVQSLLKRDDSRIPVVPRNPSMLKRNKKVQGSAPVVSLSPTPIRVPRSPSPMVCRHKKSEKCDEDIRWGFMPQDLKPN